MTDHLLLVDCSAFAYRAFYSLPALRRQSDGEPTGAVLGFASMIWRMRGAIQADPPTHAVAVFDAPGKTFRHKLFPPYKSNRGPARAMELDKQLPLMRPVADVLGLTPLEYKGFEADDVIATLADQAMRAGLRTTIVSSDKDFGQLVVDGQIEIVDPMARMRDPNKSPRRLAADVQEKFGVPPALVPDVQALAGDSVDGIPGLAGCGLETAGRLIRSFGSLHKVLENIDEIRFSRFRAELKRKQSFADMKARTGADWVRLFLKLTTLRRDAPVTLDLQGMTIKPIMRNHLVEVVKALDPHARVEALFGLDLQDIRMVERIANPLAWWREELSNPGQVIPPDPECGFFKTKLVRGGPWVPARIFREAKLDPDGVDTGYDLLRCEINGKAKDPVQMFARLAMYPIQESEFRYMVADFAHAAAYRPNDPKATPGEPIDLSKQPAPRNPRFQRTP